MDNLLGGASIGGLGGGSSIAGIGGQPKSQQEKSANLHAELAKQNLERWKAGMAELKSKTEASYDLYTAVRRVGMTVNCPQYLIDAATEFEKAHKLFEADK